MRKKYDNPAPLTMNFSFDPKLLELVANTYEAQEIEQKKGQKRRSLSEKRLNKISTFSGTTLNRNKIYRNASAAKTFFIQNMEKNSFATTRFNRINTLIQNPNNQIIIDNFHSGKNAKQTPLLTASLASFNLGKEVTKNMIKNIRKNILSANIGSSELENIESTYRQFMNKMSLKRST